MMAVLALGIVLLAGEALAVPPCGRDALLGSYGFQLTGTTGEDADNAVGYGWMKFDGMGNVVSGYSATSVKGAKAVESKSLTGTYSVAADCTFTVKVTDAAGVTSNYAGAILGRGSDLFLAQTDDGNAISGSMTKMGNYCAGMQLMGPMGFRASSGDGTTQVLGTIVPRGSVLSVVQWSTAKAKTIKFTGGTGTYKINADCTTEVKLDAITKGKDKVDAQTFKGVLSFDGQEIVSMNTAKGTIATFGAQ